MNPFEGFFHHPTQFNNISCYISRLTCKWKFSVYNSLTCMIYMIAFLMAAWQIQNIRVVIRLEGICQLSLKSSLPQTKILHMQNSTYLQLIKNRPLQARISQKGLVWLQSYILQIQCFSIQFISISNINRPMLHRSSKSIANLQNSMAKQLSHFSTIQLTLSRKSCCSFTKHQTFSLSKHHKKSIKTAITEPKTVQTLSKSRKSYLGNNLKQIVPMTLSLKSAKTLKLESKLRKKPMIAAKQKTKCQDSSLGSTNILDSMAGQCQKCYQNTKLNRQYLQKIKQQRILIVKLQDIINEM